MGPRPLLALAVVLFATGCGNERAAVPDPRVPVTPEGERAVERGGLRAVVPASWQLAPETADRKLTISSGPAVIAIWRYERAEPLPDDPASLRQARAALLDEVRERDPGFRATRASAGRFKGRRAIELRGEATIRGKRVRVRSIHVFTPRSKAELVIDAYAPPGDFERVQREVLEPVLDSLELLDVA